MNYVLGVDIGTQGTKTVLISENGQCLAQAFQGSNIIKKIDGTIEEDPEEQFQAVCKTIKECIEKSGIRSSNIASLAIAGQMAGIIGIGKEGKNVTPYDSWLDNRCDDYIKKMQLEVGYEVLENTGNFPSTNHGPKILWWKNERPNIFKRIHSIVQPGAYCAMRLCGLGSSKAFIDYTYLHFTGFAKIHDCSWNRNLCEKYGIEQEKLPRIVNPETKVGYVVKAMEIHTGLMEGTPVIAGCGDTSASLLSTGATKAGICVDVAGTASVFATTTTEFVMDVKEKSIGCGRAVMNGLWHPYAYIKGGGMNIEWFLREIANRGNTDNWLGSDFTLDKLNLLISSLKTNRSDPLFIPHLGGRVCPNNPDLRGAWLNLSWEHSIAHLYKAVLEGVALEYALYTNILKEISKDFSPKEVRSVGGGAKSKEWNQIKADVLGLPVVTLKREVGAPMGAALLAGYGVGLFMNIDETINKWIAFGDKVTPDLQNTNLIYKERIDTYKKLIDKLI
jgi:xylulokinase